MDILLDDNLETTEFLTARLPLLVTIKSIYDLKSVYISVMQNDDLQFEIKI